MQYTVPYGRREISFNCPDKTSIVRPQENKAVKDVKSEVRNSMDNPIDSPSLKDIAAGIDDAAIVINDITRPAPTKEMLEEILSDLHASGINAENIKIVIATGNHRPSSKEETIQMAGADIASRYKIVSHDCNDKGSLDYLGTTNRGLPVWVNSIVSRSSLKILTGLITPHHAAGYSGGRKSVLPGIAGGETLKIHHSFPIRPYEPVLGWLDGNPFHEEMVMAARMLKVDYIVNAISNSAGDVIGVVSGNFESAHSKGVEICGNSWIVSFNKKYDIAIVSPGGYPRDIDLHQSQKAMSVAEMVIKENGVIILIAECIDGIGKFGGWLREASTPKEVIERFRKQGFTPDHSSKAFNCARALDQHMVIVITDGIPTETLEEMFFSSSQSVEKAISKACSHLKSNTPDIIVMPYATECIPKYDA